MRQLPFCDVRSRVDDVCHVLCQVRGNDIRLFGNFAMNNREVLFLCLIPLALQSLLCRGIFRKNDNPGRITIQPVHDENALAGFGIAFPDKVGQGKICSSRFFLIGTDR